jgi:hypothetical protein
MRFGKTLLLMAVLGGLLATSMSKVHAQIIVRFDRALGTGPGSIQWIYEPYLDPGLANAPTANRFAVLPGDSFTIYDFAGFLPGPFPPLGGTTQPGGWSVSIQPVGLTPAFANPPDNPGIVNLTWTRTGAAIIPPLGSTSRIGLGTFSAFSSHNAQTNGFYASEATNVGVSGPPRADEIITVGRVAVPIPEPGTVTLLGTGTLSLLGYGWRRRKRSA